VFDYRIGIAQEWTVGAMIPTDDDEYGVFYAPLSSIAVKIMLRIFCIVSKRLHHSHRLLYRKVAAGGDGVPSIKFMTSTVSRWPALRC
jgi:hypothetical protein